MMKKLMASSVMATMTRVELMALSITCDPDDCQATPVDWKATHYMFVQCTMCTIDKQPCKRKYSLALEQKIQKVHAHTQYLNQHSISSYSDVTLSLLAEQRHRPEPDFLDLSQLAHSPITPRFYTNLPQYSTIFSIIEYEKMEIYFPNNPILLHTPPTIFKIILKC